MKQAIVARSEKKLFQLADEAERDGIPHAVVRDAGHTQLEPGTVTCIAIGPDSKENIDRITGSLSLY